MVENPRYRTRHLGESLTKTYKSRGFNVQGSWHEDTGEYSFLFMDNTDFSFRFFRDGFFMRISPTEEYIGKLEEFVKRYVESDENFEREMQSLANKDQFPKYKERLTLQEARVNSDSCTLSYRITNKMPNKHDSLEGTIVDFVLRRAFLFTIFKRN